MQIQIGHHLRHRGQPSWGVGRVVAMSKCGTRAAVRFAGRPREELYVVTRDPQLERHRYRTDDMVRVRSPDDRIVTARVAASTASGVFDVLTLESGDQRWDVNERSVVTAEVPNVVMDLLRTGRWDDARSFGLRQQTLRLDVERRCDGLGALLSSRVLVKPYQVSVAQRVLSDRAPRFVLADEVGLGKTIEAGLIASALLHARLARRILVVAPAHLCVQWLTELRGKFNQQFTLLDPERIEQFQKDNPEDDIWGCHPLVVTSLELLQQSQRAREAVADELNRWDLVIIDEAHHLRGDRAYEAAAGLATNSWGMLLLTATPMRLDPTEYFRLLRLVESAPAQSEEEFERRLGRQRDLTALVKAVETASPAALQKQAKAVAALFPADETLQTLAADVKRGRGREKLLDHLAEMYSLSSRLIRNRRAVVGGFTERRLHIVDVRPSDELQKAQTALSGAIDAAREAGTLRSGIVLAKFLRQLDSSPAAAAKVLEGQPEASLSRLARTFKGFVGSVHDAKFQALRERIQRIRRAEAGAKILVFTESRETLDALVVELTRSGIEALWYHGDLPMVERDQMVVRFRDPDGPSVMISTEAGAQGRNFQFCHSLFLYDVPWSPTAVEQRIGRLDRVGQSRPVDVYVLRPEGTLQARVVDLLAHDVQVFTETVGGLDAMLETVEPELTRLVAGGGDAAWRQYSETLSTEVRAAREAMQRDYDPLLDRRSFDREKVAQMIARALDRAGIETDEDVPSDVDSSMVLVARDLDERLEEVIHLICERLNIEFEADDAGGVCHLQLGSTTHVEALAGLDVTEERLISGTFQRDTAVERDELEYFATGHPVIESLINFVRDGELGRATVTRVRDGQQPGIGAVFNYVILPPESDDLAQGSEIPSRQAERLLDNVLVRVGVQRQSDGSFQIRDNLVHRIDEVTPSKLQTVRPDELPGTADRWRLFVEGAEKSARAEAQSRLADQLAAAIDRVQTDLALRLDRLAREAEVAEGDSRMLRAAEMVQEQNFAAGVRKALEGCRLGLDSASVVFLEPAIPVPPPAPRGSPRREESDEPTVPPLRRPGTRRA